MNRWSKLLFVGSVSLFLFACGQRGPLTLPDAPAPNKDKPETSQRIQTKDAL